MIPINFLKNECTLSWDGIHGIAHWNRVRTIGLSLADQTGAKKEIVELFAFLHDLKRRNDGWDPDHGKRAAEFIRKIQGQYLFLSNEELDLLCEACEFHSDGFIVADITVQTCWDSDRLDLGRVGIKPAREYLCTAAAKEPAMIEWAFARSISEI